MELYRSKSVALIPAIGLGVALSVNAAADSSVNAVQQGGAQQNAAAQHSGQRSDASMHGARASDVIGMNVRNQRGEDLGEINDLVIDMNNERVHYAILAFGGIAGLGEKLFAYPMHVFTRAPDGESLVLAVDEERLEAAPGFERDQWPDWQQEEGYRAQVDRYFGPTVQVEPRPNMLLRRASELLDADVTSADEDVGDVEDLVIAMPGGQVQFAVVELDRGWSEPDRLTLLPLRAFERSRQQGDNLALRLDRGQVATAPGFPADNWPDLNAGYRGELNAWFDNFDMDDASADADATR